MLKYFIVFSSVVFPFLGISQEKGIKIIQKVSNDTLFIKWVPSDKQILKSILQNETSIEWVQLDKKIPVESVVFNGKNKFIIQPLSKTLDSLEKADENYFNYFSFFLSKEVGDTSFMSNAFAYGLVQNFLDKSIAKTTGNVFSISLIEKNKYYAISIKNKGFEKKVILDSKYKDPLKIDVFNAEMDLKKVTLSWNNKTLTDNYCAFNIYKRNEEEKEFTKLNKIPVLSIAVKDSKNPDGMLSIDKNIKQGETYYYQIKAIDFFGDETGFSQIKKIYIPKEVNGIAVFDTIFMDKSSRILIGSIVSTDTLHPLNALEMGVMRSDSMEFGYQILNKIKITDVAKSTRFELKDYKTGDHYYYKLFVISPDKDTVFSLPRYFFTYDQEPPGIVTDVKGTIDSLGIMRLSWTPPKDNDIKGYRIFKANTKKEDFYEFNSNLLTLPFVTDTLALNTLTNEIYYYVTVVDNNFNNSNSSDTALLIKPDTIAPVPGVFLPHEFSEKGITLHWNNSMSEDMTKQYIVKMEGRNRKILYSWSDTLKTEYIDTNVLSGNEYKYRLIVEDKSLNKDSSDIFPISFELGYRKAIKTFSATVDRVNKVVVLSWDYKGEDVFTYQIYREKDGTPMKLYKTVSGRDPKTIIDKNVTINTNYAYKIVAILNSGLSTKMSEPVFISY